MKSPGKNLLNTFNNGDRKTFELIFETYWDPLFLHALKKAGNAQEAEDLVQDVFLDLWNKRTQVSIDTNLEPYLYTAVKYKFYKAVRNNKIVIQSFDGHEMNMGYQEDEMDFEEMYEKIQITVEKLPAKCREVFKLSRYECLSSKEIAIKLGLSPQTVNNRISMSLSLIKKEVKEYPLLLLMFFLN